jgi:chorismate mutase
VFQWLKGQGGLAGIEAVNQRKAAKLYAAVDDSNFYRFAGGRSQPLADERALRAGRRPPGCRFSGRAPRPRGLTNLKGHRSVGGMRASLYNAVPEEAVDALVDYMQASSMSTDERRQRSGLVRERIDAIDRELQRLLNERAACAMTVAQHQACGAERSAAGVLPPEREAQILARIKQENQGPLSDEVWRGCSARSCPAA